MKIFEVSVTVHLKITASNKDEAEKILQDMDYEFSHNNIEESEIQDWQIEE